MINPIINQVTPNQHIWWIDSTGILHSCSQISTPPGTAGEGIYAQGLVDPTLRAGTITHIDNKLATLASIPRELFDVLDKRFPQTRWWIIDASTQDAGDQPTTTPIPAHS